MAGWKKVTITPGPGAREWAQWGRPPGYDSDWAAGHPRACLSWITSLVRGGLGGIADKFSYFAGKTTAEESMNRVA